MQYENMMQGWITDGLMSVQLQMSHGSHEKKEACLRSVLNVTNCPRISHCYIYTYKFQTPALLCISQF